MKSRNQFIIAVNSFANDAYKLLVELERESKLNESQTAILANLRAKKEEAEVFEPG